MKENISLSDFSEKQIRNMMIRICKGNVSISVYSNIAWFLSIASKLDFEWQPIINKIERYGEPDRYCINTIGFGAHGFAVYSNNNKIIKVTNDESEVNYLFFWNYLTCCSEDRLMVPIHKFYTSNKSEGINILWKDYAYSISEYNPVSYYQQNEFYRMLKIRSKFAKVQDYGLSEKKAKNLGLYDNRVVFYDSGYNNFLTSSSNLSDLYEIISSFKDKIYNVSELKENIKKKCKRKIIINWDL